ncbi:MAG: 2-hydroxyglutaryl-CoA dehydratase [Sedimentibacter sp.]
MHNNIVEFTKDMKDEYTILVPNMLPIHFSMLKSVFHAHGYNMVVLQSEGPNVVNEGLKLVHNDTCYPALLVIGQLIDALKSENYDVNKTALMITQTGGGCRASNYIYLLRKALVKAGYENVPVISLNASNASGLEKNSGFKYTIPMLRQSLAVVAYGDLLMLLDNQTKPYEVNRGESKALVASWTEKISEELKYNKGYKFNELQENFNRISKSFADIKKVNTLKVKVGIVGEIYVKYSSLGNNKLEEFLYNENCEIMVPGLLGFIMYCVENDIIDTALYGGGYIKSKVRAKLNEYLGKLESALIKSMSQYEGFVAPTGFKHIKTLGEKVIGLGTKMGEGWLLPAEIMELIQIGYENIICTQPFGCLPNHIIGKGIISKVKRIHENANIVSIDYDPGATKVNQENRIKLMLSIAREKLQTKIM